ncbi:hypothetical protein TNCV_4736751 [Trichonephila clavipes]|nr:hypothetical protein TNCV_4736751 [Trichonephila clavipes]
MDLDLCGNFYSMLKIEISMEFTLRIDSLYKLLTELSEKSFYGFPPTFLNKSTLFTRASCCTWCCYKNRRKMAALRVVNSTSTVTGEANLQHACHSVTQPSSRRRLV